MLGLSLTMLGGARPRGLDVGLLRTPTVFYGVMCILMFLFGVPPLSRHSEQCIVTVYSRCGRCGEKPSWKLKVVLLLVGSRLSKTPRVVLRYRLKVVCFPFKLRLCTIVTLAPRSL